MSNVVSFTGERVVIADNGNADLALHLRTMAQEIDDGVHGPVTLATVLLLDGQAVVKQYHRTARHFTKMEYLGLMDVCKHQILTDDYGNDAEGSHVRD